MPHTHTMLRRLGLILASLTLIMTAIGPGTTATARQEAEVEFETEDEVVEVAAPPVLEPAWGVIGRSESSDEALTAAGWLTAVSGLQADELAPAGGDSADTNAGPSSRFTFVADITVTRTANNGPVVTTFGEGTLTVYLDAEPQPSPADQESFRSNLVVAAYDAEFQGSALAESGPAGQGVVTGRMALTQSEALSFEFEDELLRFGHAGAELELSLTGGMIPGPASENATMASYFGAARVTARSANPAGTGQATATVAELSDCEQLLAWTGATRGRLVTAGELRTSILNEGQLILPDPADAFATVSALLDEQRTEIGPEGTAEAARLALTVLNTDARGLELLETARDAGNDPAVTQALTVLADSDALASRALSVLDEITPTC